MDPSSSTGSGAPAATVAGVVLCVIGGALLLLAWVVYEFYGYCEDNCDKPASTASGAFLAALPWAVAGVVVLAVACYVLMLRGRPSRPSLFKALVLGIVATGTFSGGLFVVVEVGEGLRGAAGGPLILLAILLVVPAWIALTVALVRRASRRA
ncbi:MAG: hypothetical protein QOI62_147 [Solirubrobacteraceae bacterium]|jgi:hypothetical protein|nr:hypothetical protein [Solirubrobacteraceae bacterium]MEA2276952.1 hypothetical protein [Solirubrobacteraceae bacterium]MEA2356887.1 hypothetical protein [Solirubrobacteraceae bacterium]